MTVWTHSKSVLSVVLLFFLIAACPLKITSRAETRVVSGTASFEGVKETVSRLLSVPMYTASDEKLLNEAGDAAALAITKIIDTQEMNSSEAGRRILLILHLAFEDPASIVDRKNKTPTEALHLLDRLEHTRHGAHSNAISNARFEIKHNTSTGRAMERVTLPEEPVIDWRHTQWVSNALAWIATIKPGMTRTDLLRVVTTEGGLSTRTRRTYVLKQCPTIKVDVEFAISPNEADDKITQISKPYLDYGHCD